MLVAIDKYGTITLPASLRREFGLNQESYLEMSVEDGKRIVFEPVTVQRNIRLNDNGLNKLEEARESGTGELPEWLIGEMRNAKADTE